MKLIQPFEPMYSYENGFLLGVAIGKLTDLESTAVDRLAISADVMPDK